MEPVKFHLDVRPDDRGTFVELERLGRSVPGSSGPPSPQRDAARLCEVISARGWAQWNTSTSRPDVFRGFHFQAHPHAQAKLVTLLSGHITDYCLDLQTGVMFEFHLSPYEQLFVPPGFAHAFHTKETSTIVYACSSVRVVEAERAIRVPRLHRGAMRSLRDARAVTYEEFRDAFPEELL